MREHGLLECLVPPPQCRLVVVVGPETRGKNVVKETAACQRLPVCIVPSPFLPLSTSRPARLVTTFCPISTPVVNPCPSP